MVASLALVINSVDKLNKLKVNRLRKTGIVNDTSYNAGKLNGKKMFFIHNVAQLKASI